VQDRVYLTGSAYLLSEGETHLNQVQPGYEACGYVAKLEIIKYVVHFLVLR
jgi:hypothetical protein